MSSKSNASETKQRKRNNHVLNLLGKILTDEEYKKIMERAYEINSHDVQETAKFWGVSVPSVDKRFKMLGIKKLGTGLKAQGSKKAMAKELIFLRNRVEVLESKSK